MDKKQESYQSYKSTLYELLEETEVRKGGRVSIRPPSYYASLRQHKGELGKALGEHSVAPGEVESAFRSKRAVARMRAKSDAVLNATARTPTWPSRRSESEMQAQRDEAHAQAALFEFKQKELALKDQCSAVTKSLRRLDRVVADSVDDEVPETNADSGSDDVHKHARRSEWGKENRAKARRVVNVPAQLELENFRQRRADKMVAYQKTLSNTGKAVAKVRDDMLVHAKLELRRNAVDVFVYRNQGGRFIAALRQLMARRARVLRGHSFCARKFARKVLHTLQVHAKFSAKPRYVASIRGYTKCQEVFAALKQRAEKSKSNIRKIQSFNRNLVRHALRDWHWVVVGWRKQAYAVRRCRLFRLKKRARALLKAWKMIALIRAKFKRAFRRTPYKAAAMHRKLSLLVDHLILSRSKKLKQKQQYQLAITARTGVWLRALWRRHVTHRHRQERLLMQSNQAYYRVALLHKRRALVLLTRNLLVRARARKDWKQGLRAAHHVQMYRYFTRILFRVMCSRAARQTTSGGTGFCDRLKLAKGMRGLRHLIGKRRRLNRRCRKIVKQSCASTGDWERVAQEGEEGPTSTGGSASAESTKQKGNIGKVQQWSAVTPGQAGATSTCPRSYHVLRQAWRSSLPTLMLPSTSRKFKMEAPKLALLMGAARALRTMRDRLDNKEDWSDYRVRLDANRRKREARRYLIRLLVHVREQRALRRSGQRLGDRNRRKVGLRKGLLRLRAAAEYGRYIRHATAVQKGRRLHIIYCAFSALRRWHGRTLVLRPIAVRLRYGTKNRRDRLMASALLAWHYRAAVSRAVRIRGKDSARHRRHRLLREVLHTLKRSARLKWSIKRRYRVAEGTYRRHLSSRPFRQWARRVAVRRAVSLLYKRSDKVRMRVAMRMFHEFVERRLGYVKGVEVQDRKNRLGFRFWRSVRMLTGWRDFRHFVSIMQNLRRDLGTVDATHGMRVKRKIFTVLKERFHKPVDIEAACVHGATHHLAFKQFKGLQCFRKRLAVVHIERNHLQRALTRFEEGVMLRWVMQCQVNVNPDAHPYANPKPYANANPYATPPL